jgi:nickel transport protein
MISRTPTANRPRSPSSDRSPRTWGALAACCVATSLVAPPAGGHALLHQVLDADSVVRVEFYYPDGDRPYFESYRVMGPDDLRPFQTGRVNAAGEVSFRPDRAGVWKVLVATDDGHGGEWRISVDPDGVRSAGTAPQGLSRWERLTAAVGYLLGAFGIIALWRMRRARRPPA